MIQRGRRSANNVLQLRVDGKPPRLDPPPYLTKAERIVFKEVINACDQQHFVKSDLPLLHSFVQATVMARRNPNNKEVWQIAVRAQTELARALRLTPRSRVGPKRASRNVLRLGLPKPWEGK